MNITGCSNGQPLKKQTACHTKTAGKPGLFAHRAKRSVKPACHSKITSRLWLVRGMLKFSARFNENAASIDRVALSYSALRRSSEIELHLERLDRNKHKS